MLHSGFACACCPKLGLMHCLAHMNYVLIPLRIQYVLLLFLTLLAVVCSTAEFDHAFKDEVWCNITMPSISLFRFDPPNDLKRWRQAQILAESGEQVLMKKVREVFPHQMVFLDGDELFREYNNVADLHVDQNKDLSPLAPPGAVKPPGKVITYKWDNGGPATRPDRVLPKDYDVRSTKRAPVAMLGYYVFEKTETGPYFTGVHAGETIIERQHVFKHFNAVKKSIDKPFIMLHGANENWGIFSTIFPNRTVDWGSCCADEKNVLNLLNHDKMVLFLATQHHNLTHPKLLTLPRGLALTWERKRNVIWDILQTMPETTRKENLVFTASSSWQHRPVISNCIARKFVSAKDKKEINMRSGEGGQRKNPRSEMDYYKRLAAARLGIALPGLGYDTFRYAIKLMFLTKLLIHKPNGFNKKKF